MLGVQIAHRLITEEREKKTGFLDLGALQLSEVPREVFELEHLRSLNLGSWYVNESGKLQRSIHKGAENILQTLPKDFAFLCGLQTLSLQDTGVRDLGPLQGLGALRSLNFTNTAVSDLGALQTMTSLEYLAFSGAPVNDLRPLRSLTCLQSLYFRRTQVNDLGPLESLTGLMQLACSLTKVSDIGPLRALTGLRELMCNNSKVSDLGPLQALAALRSLECSGTKVSDLSPLQALKDLRTLDCSETKIRDLGPVTSLTALEELDCSETKISDMSPVHALLGLQRLRFSKTKVSDLGPLTTLTALEELDCAETAVSDLSPLRALKGLRELDCSGTQVNDLSPLIGLSHLKRLSASRCHLESLPRALLLQAELRLLDLDEATIPGYPPELLLGSNPKSLVEDLRNRMARQPGTIPSAHNAVPFRWDLTRRSQLGSLVEATHPDTWSALLEPLLPCAARVLAFAGDADLVFVGRSPESLFDLLSGLLFDSSWFERLILLHFSMRTDWSKIMALHPEALPALRAYLEGLALDPVRIATRDRQIALVDWVQSGGTFGHLVSLLQTWSAELGQDWNAVCRRVRLVGITERTHNSPKTRRWQQHADWIGMLGRNRIKNVSMDHNWWEYFAQFQYKVSQSHTPDRWAAENIEAPGRSEQQLKALRIAYGLFELGRSSATRGRFASLLVQQPAMREGWFRDLVRQLRA